MQVYFVPDIEQMGSGVAVATLGAQWLVEHQQEGTPFILVPVREQASTNRVIHALVAQGVQWGIPRNFPPHGWTSGPVLAPWANSKVTEVIDRNADRVTSVCILKWLEGDNRVWLAAHRAIDLTAPDLAPAAPTIADPVVLEALKGITGAVNHTNNLTTSRDRTPVVRRLQYLRDWGYELEVDEIVPWAMANGWSTAGVKALREIVEGVNVGRRFRNLDTGPIRDRGGLLREWKRAADATVE